MGNCLGSSAAPPTPRIPTEKVSSNGTKAGQPQPPAAGAVSVKRKGVSLTANVLGRVTQDLKVLYTLGRELGRGQFGVTYLCTNKETGEQLACKTIAKRKLMTREDVEDVRREVAIMHHLEGHSNIVKLVGAYEDKQNVHLVMELCAGGELFDRIIAKGHYTERSAAALLRTIVQVVEACHSLGVMHRDLKPENFLLSSKREDAPLKATDFGLSVFFKPGETFSDIVGSAYYVAPEVLRREYGPEADVWSCGIILYILLSGVPPFWAENEQGIFDAVLRGNVDFDSAPWPHISSAAKDLVKKMLKQDPKQRLSANSVLNHPWVKPDGSAPDKPLDPAVVSRLKQFSAMNKMKKLALRVIATSMNEEEIMGLKELFKSMDTDNSGSITYEELKAGLKLHGTNMPEAQMQQLMEAADVDQDGSIDYKEFITATMAMNKMEKDDKLRQAFRHFDKDESGFISMDELRTALSEDSVLEAGEIEDIIREVDTDNDGNINYAEFEAMMKKGNPAEDGKSTTRAPRRVPSHQQRSKHLRPEA